MLVKSNCEDSLVEPYGVFLQGKHVVGKHDDFVVAPLVEADEELASSEFVGVHGVKQDPLLRLDGHIFSVKLRGHRAPYLKQRHNSNAQTDLTGKQK